VAALEPSDAAVVAGSGVKYLQGEAFLLDEAGLNFTVKQVWMWRSREYGVDHHC